MQVSQLVYKMKIIKQNIMKKKTIILISTIIVLALVAYLIFGRNKADSGKIIIETAKVATGTISETINCTGTVQAQDTVEVGTQVSGIIDKIYVDFNSVVKKGQLIATIDTTNLAASLEQSKATLDNAKAEVDYQQANYNRMNPLIEKNLISQDDFDQVVYNLKVAKAKYSSAKASYRQNQINLDYAFIHSPIDGVITRRAVQEGQTVAASFSTPTMFVIAKDLTEMQVQAKVDEADIGQVKEGQRVEFKVDAFPNDTFNGIINQIRLSPGISNNVVTYTVIINAPNPDKKLLPGLTADIYIYVKEDTNLMVLPSKAARFSMDEKLLTSYMKNKQPEAGMPKGDAPKRGEMPQETGDDSNMKTFWVMTKDSILQPRMVKTGQNDDINVEIISGLKMGDQVITSMKREEKKEVKKQGSNPFMPGPPGRKNKDEKAKE